MEDDELADYKHQIFMHYLEVGWTWDEAERKSYDEVQNMRKSAEYENLKHLINTKEHSGK